MRDQDTIRNPPAILPSDPPARCVNLFLNQFASRRANHVPAYIDERGRRAVYSLRSRGRKWWGLEGREEGAEVGEMGRECKGSLPFSLSRFSPSSPTPPLFVHTTKASLFI